jgi:hypothetical protein
MNGRLIDLAAVRGRSFIQVPRGKSFIGRIWLLAGAGAEASESESI